MARKPKENRRISRRDFLKGAGIAAGGAALGGMGIFSACVGGKTETATSTITANATKTSTVTTSAISTVTSVTPPQTVTATITTTTTTASALVKVMNPLGFPPLVEQKSMAVRPSSLMGKKIYLVDVTFDDGDIFLQQMKDWFTRNMPQVTTEYRVKKGLYSTNDTKLWQEIKDSSGVMIMAIGH